MTVPTAGSLAGEEEVWEEKVNDIFGDPREQ